MTKLLVALMVVAGVLVGGTVHSLWVPRLFDSRPYLRELESIPGGAHIDFANMRSQVVWAADGQTFTLVASGSSSCPADPQSLTVIDEKTISIALRVWTGWCTADLTFNAYEFARPDGVSGDANVVTTYRDKASSVPRAAEAVPPPYPDVTFPDNWLPLE